MVRSRGAINFRQTLDEKSGEQTIVSFAYELDAAGIRLSVTDKDGKYYGFGRGGPFWVSLQCARTRRPHACSVYRVARTGSRRHVRLQKAPQRTCPGVGLLLAEI
ncbi:MAG: hypothetical protein ACR2HJ_07645 [Fimbriimonadales bacterium]